MRNMTEFPNQPGPPTPTLLINTSTSLDCAKDGLTFRSSLRSLLHCVFPYFCASQPYSHSSSPPSTLTATFFGHRKGRVSLCIHHLTKNKPLLLLQFPVPTAYLAREMKSGVLRITLECSRSQVRSSTPLFAVPVWAAYCNGRKVGFAVRRPMTESEAALFDRMRSVSVGVGVLPGGAKPEDGELMYLRAKFERVTGSADSESLHMINPVGSSGQELSIFLLRS